MMTPRVRGLAACSSVLLLLMAVALSSAQTTPPAPRPAPVRTAPVSDSLPSATARKVLDRIPEPLPASQQIAPPARKVVPAPAEASDTLRVVDTTDSSAAGVPVPAVTQPLSQPSSPGLVMPDTLPASAPPVATQLPAQGGIPVADGACWRVQVAAPEQRAMAESRREAAESLLLVPMTIETERGLHKVRTRGCLTREAADAIKRRATDSGFSGVFLVNTAAGAVAPARPAATKKKKAVAPTARRKK